MDCEIKLNLGCGLDVAPDWYNIDNSSTITISRIPFARKILPRIPAWPKSVRREDVTKGLRFGDATVSVVYSSHFFEHLTYETALALAKECFRVLKPGGVFRISVPDLKLAAIAYMNSDDPLASHAFIRRLLLEHSFMDILHPGSNHSQMFDAQSLIHLFKTSGFPDPEVSSYGNSRIAGIEAVEPDGRKHESLYVEAVKPS